MMKALQSTPKSIPVLLQELYSMSMTTSRESYLQTNSHHLKKRILKGRLTNISKGKANCRLPHAFS